MTDYPLTIRHRDGKLVDVLYNASVYTDTRGNVLGVFAAARDVTESKRVMRQFEETKTFLDNILESSTKYSIIGKDLNHRKSCPGTRGARRNYGYTAEQTIGMDSSILHSPGGQRIGGRGPNAGNGLRERIGGRRVRARAQGWLPIPGKRRRNAQK